MIAFTENLAGESAKSRIEKGARSYNELRGELAAVIGELNEKIEALTLKKLPLIKKLAGRAAEKHKELETAILAAPQLFEKPRTAVFHGIKCGFRKNEGRIEFDDPESVVEKIQQFFDAPEPWGPWTTVCYVPRWDVEPGESANFPTKWMSADGRTVHLVYSGGDSFNVRRAVLTLETDKKNRPDR